MEVIAKYADIWNLSGSPTPQEFQEKANFLKDRCIHVGRNHTEIEHSITHFVCLGKNPNEVKKAIGSIEESRRYLLSRAIIGTPSDCVKRIQKYVDCGVSYFMLSTPDITDLRSLNLLGEVISHFGDI